MNTLNPEEITKGMQEIDDWFYVDKSLEKEFKLKTFADPLAFIIKIGIESEKMKASCALRYYSALLSRKRYNPPSRPPPSSDTLLDAMEFTNLHLEKRPAIAQLLCD